MTQTTKGCLTLAGLAALAIALPVCFLVFSEWPGGMRPTYDAKDHDPRLTRVAATARPVIVALARYHNDHAAFPPEAGDLASYLPRPPEEAEQPGPEYLLGWHSFNLKRDGGYVISYRLGWDPDLKYYSDGSESRWAFSPGDGTPEKTIVLKP
jgi:hypothetical protein